MLAGDDAGPVASTSKAVPSSTTAPSSSSSVKRYAGSLATPANPPQKKHRSSAAFGDKPGVYRPPPLPHYTLVRSANNSKASPHVIRIHDDASDGSDTRWPSEAERQPDHKVAGRQNYYECPPRDVGKHKSFREKLGEELASKLGLAEQEPGASWIIEDLPKGHLFTVHHCVTKSNQPRTDVYVFGAPPFDQLSHLSVLTVGLTPQAPPRRSSSAPPTSSSRTCTGSSRTGPTTRSAASASTAPRRASRT